LPLVQTYQFVVSESYDAEGTSVFYGRVARPDGTGFPAAFFLHIHKTEEQTYIVCTVQALR